MKRALAALLCLGALFGAGAKADYPDRGVKIIVPFPLDRRPTCWPAPSASN